MSDSIAVTVSITDVNETPAFAAATATRSIAENTAAATAIGAPVAATDPDSDDTLTYTLTGTDAASFAIVASSGQIQTKAALDYETKTSYTVTVTATDGGSPALSDSVTVTISVTNVNEAPDASGSAAVSYAENGNGDVASYSVTDPDADSTHIWSVEGTDASSFSISAAGVLTFDAPPDYETTSSYAVTVKATDNGTPALSDSIAVTVTITDVNEAPVVSGNTTISHPENRPANPTVAGLYSVADPDTGDTHTWTLEGADKDSFTIHSQIGDYQILRFKTAPDYETKSSYAVTIKVADNGSPALSHSIAVTITITDANEAPVFATDSTSRSIAENTTANTNIGTPIMATDPDSGDTLTYSLTGTDDASFSIVASSGQLKTKAALNYEAKSSYSVTVTASDGSLSDSITVTIRVTDVNETEYREVKHWSDGLGKTTGPWSTNSNPSGAPNVGNSNWFHYRDNGGAGGTWTWEERIEVTWTNPQT